MGLAPGPGGVEHNLQPVTNHLRQGIESITGALDDLGDQFFDDLAATDPDSRAEVLEHTPELQALIDLRERLAELGL